MKKALRNKRGFTLIELILVMGVSGILLVTMVAMLNFGLAAWSETRMLANAINLANEMTEEIRKMTESAYALAIVDMEDTTVTMNGVEASPTNDPPAWVSWDTTNVMDSLIYCFDYTAVDSRYAGRLMYQIYNEGTAPTAMPIPSKYHKNLCIADFRVSRLLNYAALENDSVAQQDVHGPIFEPLYQRYDILSISFTVITKEAVRGGEAQYGGRKKIYDCSASFLIANLASNYNIASEGVTNELVAAYMVNIRRVKNPTLPEETTPEYKMIIYTLDRPQTLLA